MKGLLFSVVCLCLLVEVAALSAYYVQTPLVFSEEEQALMRKSEYLCDTLHVWLNLITLQTMTSTNII